MSSGQAAELPGAAPSCPPGAHGPARDQTALAASSLARSLLDGASLVGGPVEGSSLDATLGALADPVRRRAVELLATSPRRAGELAAALGVSAPTMSKHLRALREAGLVAERTPAFDARVRIYELRSGALGELRRWLADAERAWSAELAAFSDYVDDQRAR